MSDNKPDATAALAQTQEPAAPQEAEAVLVQPGDDQFYISPTLADAANIRPYERRTGDPLYRSLQIFTLDPTISTLDGAIATLKVPYERLEPGPVGSIFEVDNDDGFQRNQRVDLDDPFLLMNDGLAPTPSDPRFHQQMVYAVASSVYAVFRTALGRHIAWSIPRQERGARTRLMLRPHALKGEKNAFYDKTIGAIQFGYFRAAPRVSGSTLPGSWVFTCLSHDVVTHEVTHALLDGLRANFTIPTNPDVPAFHEALGDLVAVFQHFSYNDVLEKAIAKSRGRLRIAPLLTNLAWQFSQAQEGNPYGKSLRSAVDARRHNEPRKLYREDLEPHALGAVLVAAVFEAFTTIFDRKVKRYVQLATNGSGILPRGDLSPYLVEMLAKEASQTARQFMSLCIRAVDYCPPVDLSFGDYLRALITSDYELVPDDPWRYREALIDAFRLHGIFPGSVPNLSEDALIWRAPEERLPECPGLSFESLRFRAPSLPSSATELQRQAFALGRFIVADDRARLFGLIAPAAAAREGLTVTQPCIHSIRSTRRVGPDGQTVFDLVAEVTQRRVVRLPDGRTFPMYGGATVILDPDGRIRYVVRKGIKSEVRETEQRDYLASAAGQRLWMRSGQDMEPRAEMFRFLHDGREDTGT